MRNEHPWKRIESGDLAVDIYLPDAEKGYYVAKRFDWSGVIGAIRYKGHSFTDEWRTRDRLSCDSLCGPVNEFRAGENHGSGGPGYDEADAGDVWLKPGVGLLLKPDDQPYNIFTDFELMDSGNWSVEATKDRISFTQKLGSSSTVWGYIYTKTIQLKADESVMAIDYRLENTGSATIDTQVYNHNFFTIDESPIGPDYSLSFPFPAELSNKDPRITLSEDGRTMQIHELIGEDDFFADVSGHDQSPKNNQFVLSNLKTGASVEARGFQPLTVYHFWCMRTTICPEPYIRITVAPGETANWQHEYRFQATL